MKKLPTFSQIIKSEDPFSKVVWSTTDKCKKDKNKKVKKVKGDESKAY